MPHPSQFNTQVIALYLLLFDYSKHVVGNPLIEDSSDDIIPGNSQKESTFGIQVLKKLGQMVNDMRQTLSPSLTYQPQD